MPSYPTYKILGRDWPVPYKTVICRDGTEGISLAEITRVHRIIAAHLLGRPEPLTEDEREFLFYVFDLWDTEVKFE